MTAEKDGVADRVRAKRRRLFQILLGGLFAALAVAMFVLRSDELRAASLLLRFGNPAADGFAKMRSAEVVEEELPLEYESRGTRVDRRGRLYLPRGERRDTLGGVVLSHGVHRLGIDEPRLQRFARAIASAGIAVYTPELVELADYRIAASSVTTIARAAERLASVVGRKSVGVMGFSFAGGLSMLAAGDPLTNGSISFVVSIGGYDDLERVLRFFVEDKIEKASGEFESLKAHPYGPLVLVYGHAEDFFRKEDVAAAREALRLWLWEKRDDARARLSSVGPEAKTKLEVLFAEKPKEIAAEIRACIERHRELMREVSPHEHLRDLDVPVFLLHGAGDSVIPATETRWLEKDCRGHARRTVVTRAVEHVELQGEPSLGEKWELVTFMASILSAAESEPRAL